MISKNFEQVKGERKMGWSTIKLGEVLKHRKGYVNIDDDKEYKLCRVQLHRKGVLLREEIKGSEIRTKKQQVCKGGDFLVAEMDAKFGGYGFIPPELEGAIVSSHYFLFELDQNKIRPDYLEVVSQLNIIQSQIKAVGSTNYSAVRPVNVLNWEIPITSIDNQIKIENLFNETKEGSNLLTIELIHQLALVKKLRQQFLREAVQGKLVPQDNNEEPASDLLMKIKAEKAKGKKYKELPAIKPEEIPFDIPDKWVWCRLGDVSLVQRGKGPKYSDNNFFRMLNQKCVRWYVVDKQYAKSVDQEWLESLSNDFVVDNNDVLVNSTGDGTIGRSALADMSIKGYAFDSHILKVKSAINQMYICYLINSDFGQSLVESVKGATSTKQTELGVGNLMNFHLPLPPLSEQQRIVAKLDELMQTCDELEVSINESKGQNEQLLQQVLREALKAD